MTFSKLKVIPCFLALPLPASLSVPFASINSWDATYLNELRNFTDHGDVGEIWFGEDSILRVIRWLSTSSLVTKTDRIIDLGCGNGMMLIELAREGFTDLTGVDYSQGAIDLARSVALSQDLSGIHFELADLSCPSTGLTSYNVALDKGTYDAISLDLKDALVKKKCYIANIVQLLSPRGLFIITSCNWTESELMKHFTAEFDVVHILPTPKFRFGGKIGSLVSSLVLRKIH